MVTIFFYMLFIKPPNLFCMFRLLFFIGTQKCCSEIQRFAADNTATASFFTRS